MDVGDNGVAIPADESRLTEEEDEQSEPVEDATESLEARRERAAEMNMRVSCSVMGDGPGTGGKGADGGRDKGGLGLGKGLFGMLDKGVVASGVVGMWEGGTGKEERRRGTSLRLLPERDSTVVVAGVVAAAVVVVVVDVAMTGEKAVRRQRQRRRTGHQPTGGRRGKGERT